MTQANVNINSSEGIKMKHQFSMRSLILTLSLCFCSCISAMAGGASCGSATALVPDGRILSLDFVQPSSTAWYSFNAKLARSYSIEVRDDLDPQPGTPPNVTFYTTTGACPGTSLTAATGSYTPTTFRHISALDPILVSAEHTGNTNIPLPVRVSLPSAGLQTYYISVSNTDTAGHYLSVSVSETTLYSSQWSTYANFDVAWDLAFQGSSGSVNGMLSVVCTGLSTCTSTKAFALTPSSPTNSVSARTGLSIPANAAGIAYFSHDGPPNSVLGDMEMENGNWTACCMISGKFEASRQNVH